MRSKKISIYFAALILAAGMMMSVFSCSEKGLDSDRGDGIRVPICLKLESGAMASSLDHFIITVTAADLERPIVGRLEIINGMIIGEVVVPPGRDRLFVVEGVDEAGNVIYRGQTRADVAEDIPITIEINIYPQVPMIRLSPLQQVILQRDRFTVDVKAHNIPYLNGLSFEVIYDASKMYFSSAEVDSGLMEQVNFSYYYGDTSVYVTIYDLSSLPIVDDSGYVKLATIGFSSYYADQIIDSTYLNIRPTWISGTTGDGESYIIDPDGDTIWTESVYGEGSELILESLSLYGVAFWTFNETSGDTVFDYSGNNLHGMAYNSSIVDGFARDFDGESSYIEVQDNDLLDITDQLTVVVDLYMYEPHGGVLISKRIPEGEINYQIEYRHRVNSDFDDLYFAFGPYGGSIANRALVNLDDGYWHQIIISINFESNPVELVWVIDGQEIAGQWLTGAEINTRPKANSEDLQIGRQLSSYNGLYFYGWIDNMSIYNIALTTEQIRRHLTPQK